MKKEPHKYASQRRYETAQKEDDLVRISIWVPRSARQKAINYGAKLRKEG